MKKINIKLFVILSSMSFFLSSNAQKTYLLSPTLALVDHDEYLNINYIDRNCISLPEGTKKFRWDNHKFTFWIIAKTPSSVYLDQNLLPEGLRDIIKSYELEKNNQTESNQNNQTESNQNNQTESNQNNQIESNQNNQTKLRKEVIKTFDQVTQELNDFIKDNQDNTDLQRLILFSKKNTPFGPLFNHDNEVLKTRYYEFGYPIKPEEKNQLDEYFTELEKLTKCREKFLNTLKNCFDTENEVNKLEAVIKKINNLMKINSNTTTIIEKLIDKFSLKLFAHLRDISDNNKTSEYKIILPSIIENQDELIKEATNLFQALSYYDDTTTEVLGDNPYIKVIDDYLEEVTKINLSSNTDQLLKNQTDNLPKKKINISDTQLALKAVTQELNDFIKDNQDNTDLQRLILLSKKNTPFGPLLNSDNKVRKTRYYEFGYPIKPEEKNQLDEYFTELEKLTKCREEFLNTLKNCFDTENEVNKLEAVIKKINNLMKINSDTTTIIERLIGKFELKLFAHLQDISDNNKTSEYKITLPSIIENQDELIKEATNLFQALSYYDDTTTEVLGDNPYIKVINNDLEEVTKINPSFNTDQLLKNQTDNLPKKKINISDTQLALKAVTQELNDFIKDNQDNTDLQRLILFSKKNTPFGPLFNHDNEVPKTRYYEFGYPIKPEEKNQLDEYFTELEKLTKCREEFLNTLKNCFDTKNEVNKLEAVIKKINNLMKINSDTTTIIERLIDKFELKLFVHLRDISDNNKTSEYQIRLPSIIENQDELTKEATYLFNALSYCDDNTTEVLGDNPYIKVINNDLEEVTKINPSSNTDQLLKNQNEILQVGDQCIQEIKNAIQNFNNIIIDCTTSIKRKHLRA